jgi:CTP:molybdopterin cytidylyltransferase MocA
LLQLRGDQGARSVLALHEVHRVEVNDEGCVLDVDTLDALALAEKRLSERHRQKSSANRPL